MRLRPSPLRPFNLGDLMVLVAAVAIGIALQRRMEGPVTVPAAVASVSSLAAPTTSKVDTVYFSSGASNGFDYVWFGAPGYQAWALTVALVILRWRRPRPSWRRIARQPGAVACLAVVIATLVGLAVSEIKARLWVIDPSPSPSTWFPLCWWNHWHDSIGWASLAVAGVWTTLVLRGRWRPERSWIDRAGRALGWYWLLGLPLIQLFGPLFNVYIGFSNDLGSLSNRQSR